MYKGDVRVKQSELEMFLDTARELQIEGLVSEGNETKEKETVLQNVEDGNEIKSEPVLDNHDELGYPDSSYAEDGNCSVSRAEND